MPIDLNRKAPPTGDVTIERTCSTNFLKAKTSQRADSFVGVTVLPPKVAIPTFYMFPCFMKSEGWAISSARTDDSPDSKSARLSKPLVW